MGLDTQVPVLKMGSSYQSSCASLDPAKIRSLKEYELIRHIFAGLVEFKDQKFVATIPERFYWQDDELIFEFATLHKTRSGNVITAEDAYLSLKRAMYLGRTGHGDLRNFLCPGHVLNSFDGEYPGLSFSANQLRLKPYKKALADFLLPFLSSADFSIIPKRSMDPLSGALLESAFNDSTGAYFVSMDDPNGGWLMKANENYPEYSSLMPQTVQLVPSTYWNIFEKLQTGEVDFAPTYMSMSWNEKASEVFHDTTRFNVSKSAPLVIWMVCFTPKAIATTSLAHRMKAASLLATVIRESLLMPGGHSTSVFFQEGADGSLNQAQQNTIAQIRNETNANANERPLQYAVPTERFEHFREKFKGCPEIEVVSTRIGPYLLPVEERGDMYSVATDTSPTESISLLGHGLASSFYLPGMERDEWLADYTHTEDKEARLEKLRTLHFEMLKLGVIYPISANPYLTYAKKPWIMHSDPQSPEILVWQMRLED